MKPMLATLAGAILLSLAACADGDDSQHGWLRTGGVLERPAGFLVQQLRQQPTIGPRSHSGCA